MSILDAFGRLAEETDDRTLIAGRYGFQAEDEYNIVPDVIAKLRLDSWDDLLEIGCGAGNLLLPLSDRVRSATGVDHEACLARMVGAVPANVTLVPGRWPGAPVSGPFSRILVYSVLHSLSDTTAAATFIDACITALSDDGWLLLGDLPNRDAVTRFTTTAFGQRFLESWRHRVEGASLAERARDEAFASLNARHAFIGDDFILATLARLRRQGLEAYVLPQDVNLPFGPHSRGHLGA